MPTSKINPFGKLRINGERSRTIKSIKAREILDSRGNPTIEANVETNLGIFSASVPSGASTGKYEAFELRDGEKRYNGKGVLKAVKNVNEIIGPELKGKDVTWQDKIDKLLIDLDGTENKFKLGANAILAVSMAVCRAGAAAQNLPLYKYLAQLTEVEPLSALPVPCFNLINGGVHAGNDLAIQEFMVVPQNSSFAENLRIGCEIYYNLKEILIKKFGKQATNVGDEGGFAPPLSKTIEALNLLKKVQTTFPETKIGIDCASTQFYQNEKYHLDEKSFSTQELLKFYQSLLKRYPIIFFEDPFSEEDWKGWKLAMSNIKYQISNITVFGDDLLTTNPKRIKEAKEKKACNGVIIKPNQIGTVTETLEAAKLAESFGPEGKPSASYGASWKIMVAHRSGETCDDFIADLAVGIGADFIKAGAPARGERVAKYNRLLKIEEELSKNSGFI